MDPEMFPIYSISKQVEKLMNMGGFPEKKRNVEQKGTVEELACLLERLGSPP